MALYLTHILVGVVAKHMAQTFWHNVLDWVTKDYTVYGN